MTQEQIDKECVLKKISKQHVKILCIVHGNHNAPSGIEFHMDQYHRAKTVLTELKSRVK